MCRIKKGGGGGGGGEGTKEEVKEKEALVKLKTERKK